MNYDSQETFLSRPKLDKDEKFQRFGQINENGVMLNKLRDIKPCHHPRNDMMKLCNQIAVLVFITLIVLMGCRGPAGRLPSVEPQPEHGITPVAGKTEASYTLDQRIFSDTNSYYLYLESQFQRKKGNLENAVFFLELAASRDPESLFLKKELVVLYLQQENHQKALVVMEPVLAAEPDNIDVMLMVAAIKKSLQMDGEAVEIYEKILTVDPERRNIYYLLGKIYLETGDLPNATRIFMDMSKRFEDDYMGYYYLGRISQAEDDLEDAEKLFLKALEKAPYLIEPRLELIRIYDKSGQDMKLIAVYEEILELYPDNIPTSIELGLLYHKKDMTEPAAAIFKTIGRQSLEDPNITRTLLQNLILQKRDEEALVILKQMLAEAPENTEIRYLAGVVHENLGDLEEAIDQFETIEPDTRYYPTSAIHLAIIFYKLDDLEKGIAALESAMGVVSDDDKVQMIPYLASFYKEKDMMDQALALVSSGLEMKPDNPGLLYERGVIYDRMGDTGAAMEQMAEVVRLDPDHADALNYIGYTYAEQGINLDEAERLIIKALNLKPNNGYIIDSLGWVYYQKGLFEEALVHLERAAELVPEDPIILEHLGDVYMKLEQPEKAIKIYERALLHKDRDTDKIQQKIDALRQEGF